MIIKEGITAVLIAPHWPNEERYVEVQPYVQRSYFFKADSQIFVTFEGSVGVEKWTVLTLPVNGKTANKTPTGWQDSEDGSVKFPRTADSSRRWRKKWVTEHMC